MREICFAPGEGLWCEFTGGQSLPQCKHLRVRAHRSKPQRRVSLARALRNQSQNHRGQSQAQQPPLNCSNADAATGRPGSHGADDVAVSGVRCQVSGVARPQASLASLTPFWRPELEARGLALSFLILYVVKLGRLESKAAVQYQDVTAFASDSRSKTRRQHAGAVAGSGSGSGVKKARIALAKKRKKRAKERDELSITREEMAKILEKRQKELEVEIEMKRKILEKEKKEKKEKEEKDAAETTSTTASEGGRKFSFEDVKDEPNEESEAGGSDTDTGDGDPLAAKQARLDELEKEKREREQREEAEKQEMRQKLQEMKEEIESSRHVSVAKSPLDICGSYSLAAQGKIELVLEMPSISKSFSFVKDEEQSMSDFAMDVCCDLKYSLRKEISDGMQSLLHDEENTESSLSSFGFDILFLVQCVRLLFEVASVNEEACLGESLFLRFNPSCVNDVSNLEGAYERCLGTFMSGEGDKSSFLQQTLELMLSLDAELERGIVGSSTTAMKMKMKRLSFFPIFDRMFHAVEEEEDTEAEKAKALGFLRSRTRDILRTILSLEGDSGFRDFKRVSALFNRNKPLHGVFEAVEKRIQLEAKRKSFSTLRKLSSKSAGVSPIPEKSWALRNVAGTLALKTSSPSQISQARKMYEESVRIKQEYFASDTHPGLLEDLLPLAKLFSRQTDQVAEESLVYWERICAIVSDIVDVLDGDIGTLSGGDSTSLSGDGGAEYCSEITMGVTVALREALGPSHALTQAWKSKSMAYFDVLGDKQQEQVFARMSEQDVLQQLSVVFSCDIESRRTSSAATTNAGKAALKALECYELP